MKATKFLVAVATALFSSLVVADPAMAASTSQPTNCSIPKLTTQELVARIEALKVDREMCRRENLRLLYDNVTRGGKSTMKAGDVQKLETQLDDFVHKCKSAHMW